MESTIRSRTARRALVATSLMLTLTIAPLSWGRPTGPLLRPADTYTATSYEFATTPDGDLTAFVMHTSLGHLEGTVDNAGAIATIAVLHVPSGLEAITTITPTMEPGVSDVHVRHPQRSEDLYFRSDVGADSLELIAMKGLDCNTLSDSPLYLAQAEAILQLADEYGYHAEPPVHLTQLLTALHISRALPAVVPECEGLNDPMVGGCNNLPTYNSCSGCCDTGFVGFALTAICGAGGSSVCGFWCGVGATSFCGGLVELGESFCEVHNCTGKPGDPGCNQSQQCEGSCQATCGIGQSAGCGECPNYDQPVCCANR